MRVAARLAAFAVVLAAAFGGAYALGDATLDDGPAPVTTDHPMDGVTDDHQVPDTSGTPSETTP